MLTELPDLPGLESVEQDNFSGASWTVRKTRTLLLSLVSLCLSVLLSIQIFELPAKHKYIGAYFGFIAVAMLFCPSIWMITRILCCKTSREGLLIKKLWGQRLVPWEDIEGFKTGSYNKLVTKHGIISIPLYGIYDPIKASIAQHLKLHKNDPGNLKEDDAMAYWIPVPDFIPTELEWAGPNQIKWKYRMGVAIVFACLLYAGLVSFGEMLKPNHIGENIFLAWIPFTPALVYVSETWKSRHNAARAKLTGDEIAVTLPNRSVTIPLSQVTSAEWKAASLEFSDSAGNIVNIPFSEYNPGSALIILAIIRELRKSDKIALPVTEQLSKAVKV